MSSPSSERPVKRGDLVVVVHVSRVVATSGSGLAPYETTQVSVGVATSVTRTGEVKAWRTPFADYDTDPPARPFHTGRGDRTLSVDATTVDVAAVLDDYRAHVYPGHPQIRPYACLDELQAVLDKAVR